jgi:hypothetical protein
MMLQQHINDVEALLLQTSRIPANAGHTLHRGTPREAFIRQFLESHLTELIGFGSGEIIDCNSQPRQQRNQIDIVLYKKNYPKLDFGGGISGFLAESVAATIEVKSLLTQQELETAFNSIRNTKALQRNIETSFMTGYQAPGILSVVIAYDGPANMSTVQGWITQYVSNNNIQYPDMPPTLAERVRSQSPLADLIIVLGKGFIQFDNSPISFIQDSTRQTSPTAKWFVSDNINGNLLMLFSQMTVALSGVSANWLDIIPYLTNFRQNNNSFVP